MPVCFLSSHTLYTTSSLLAAHDLDCMATVGSFFIMTNARLVGLGGFGLGLRNEYTSWATSRLCMILRVPPHIKRSPRASCYDMIFDP